MTLKHLLLASSLCLLTLPAKAESWWPVGSDDQSTYEQSLNDLRAAPSDSARLAAFANAATRIGNFEAAIGALESILIQRPDLPLVRLELGVLYFRVAAYAAAQFNIQRALDQGLDGANRERGEEFLAAAIERQNGRTLRGSVGFGFGWDSNPSARTSSEAIWGVVFDGADEGTLIPADLLGKEEGDLNLYGFGDLLWREDMGNQWGETWDTTVKGFGRGQFDEDIGSLFYGRATTGPRLAVMPGSSDNFFFRPYIESDFVALDEGFNSASLGTGGTLSKRFSIGLTLAADGGFKHRWMLNGEEEDNANVYDGSLRAIFSLTEDVTLTTKIGYERVDAEEGYSSHAGLIAGGSVNWRYNAPFDLTDYPWELDFTGEWHQRNYDDPDPLVLPGVSREDDEFRLVARNTVGLSRSWFLFIEGGTTWVESNIENYTYDNQFVSGGAIFRF